MLKRKSATAPAEPSSSSSASLSLSEELTMPVYVNRLHEYWTMDESIPSIDESTKANREQEATLKQKESAGQDMNLSDSRSSSIGNFLPKYKRVVDQAKDTPTTSIAKKQKITGDPSRKGTPIPARAAKRL